MRRRATNLLNRRVLAVAIMISSAAGCVWGDAIQFSKPAVAIASPAKDLPELPETKSKIEFGSNPTIERPLAVAPPPVVRIPPTREREDDEDANRHPLLREPKSFSEVPGQSESRNRLRNGKSSSSSWGGSGGNNRTEPQNALSPIKDLNWDPRDRDHDRDREQRRNESLSSSRSESNDRTDARSRELYGAHDQESEQKDPFSAPPVPDPFTYRPKEGKESLSAQMERRAAFEQLFNPGGVVVQPPGSLEPVTGLEAAKPSPTAAMPTLAGPKLELAPSDPANALRVQQERMHAPVLEGLGNRFSQPAAPAASAPVESRFQTSLMRQPTVHDIPARKGL